MKSLQNKQTIVQISTILQRNPYSSMQFRNIYEVGRLFRRYIVEILYIIYIYYNLEIQI